MRRINKSFMKAALVLCTLAAIAVCLIKIVSVVENRRFDRNPQDNSHIRVNLQDPSGQDDPYANDNDRAVIVYDGKKYTEKENIEKVLLIGIDKYENEIPEAESYGNDQNADFLMLLIFDNETETYTGIQINRDTMAEMPVLAKDGKKAGSVTSQIALAHTYGSGKDDSSRNTADTVSNLLFGTKIDHYVAMTLDGISILNDQVGGVPVEIKDDFSRVDASLVQGTTMTLNGAQAVMFVRARGNLDDSSNLARMARQRDYLKSFEVQARNKLESDSTFVYRLLLTLSEYLISDCTADELASVAEAMNRYENLGIETIEGEAIRGEQFMEYYPDEEALKTQVIRLLYEEADEN